MPKMLMAMNAVKKVGRGCKQRNEDVFNLYYVCSGLDPSSETRRNDCNRDAPAGFAG
jgi:hypothetical protein